MAFDLGAVLRVHGFCAGNGVAEGRKTAGPETEKSVRNLERQKRQ